MDTDRRCVKRSRMTCVLQIHHEMGAAIEGGTTKLKTQPHYRPHDQQTPWCPITKPSNSGVIDESSSEVAWASSYHVEDFSATSP